jgi:hypothetical protein
MIKRVLFASILAAQLVAFAAIQRADDPVPCPECDPGSGGGGPGLAFAVVMRADDPVPCPECDPGSGGGGPGRA